MNTALNQEQNYVITTEPDDIVMGLFGGLTLFVFEVLPYLKSNSIFPEWNIRSSNYGKEPDFKVIPGVFDLAYTPNTVAPKEVSLLELRKHHTYTLGNDWKYLNELWATYFKIPERILTQANEAGDLSQTLGLHYRGTDKKTSSWDTNPVSQEEFLILVGDFIQEKGDIKRVLIATDEFSFVQTFQKHFPGLQVLNMGETEYHLQSAKSSTKADRALLDCVLLSRCKYMINTSSALSAFAKVFNPELECYRVAASKLFGEMPYFPVAYIPTLTSNDPECQKILSKLLRNDWRNDILRNKKYELPFATYRRSHRAIWWWKFRKKVVRFVSRVRKKLPF